MSNYRRILTAVDLSDDSALVLEKALVAATQHAAELHLIHVMEPVLVGFAAEVASIDAQSLQNQADQRAREALLAMGRKTGIPSERLHAVVGQPAHEIREQAKRLKADLIVMGGHGKHGLDLLLGSTSSGVTHGVPCDLLIVRIPD